MTERLYYHDSFLREFDAQVLTCRPADGKFHVVLDRTAFYPTSGGQPNDTGKLGDATVLDVLDADTGEILHVVDRAVPEGPVHGAVDWPRRFDHMQQHTGQHILSAVFLAQFGHQTVGFHLGREASTIDLAAPAVSTGQLEEAEQRVNQIIFDDRPVTIRFGSREELATAGVRKEVDREGLLRAIAIEGVEVQPCGGTHVARTGQIGLLLVRKCEKQKGNWRVEFVCGGRAWRTAKDDRRLLLDAARTLGGAPAEVPGLVARAAEERKVADRLRKELQARLAAYEAGELWQQSPESKIGARVVSRVLDTASAEYLRLLATKVAERGRAVALLASRAAGHVVFAQSADMPGEMPLNMNDLLRVALAPVGGKGGGTREFAQGSSPDPAKLEDILRAAFDRLTIPNRRAEAV